MERRYLAAAPALIARPDGPSRATVLWYHGLGVDKETHAAELERFARAGFIAIGLDAAGHGERRLPNFEERFAPPRAVIEPLLFQLIEETVAELPSVFDELPRSGLDSDGRIAVAGVSFGAFITYRAVIREPRLRAAVALLGEPPESIEGLWPTALLSITAGNDTNVPPQKASVFHERLEPRYATAPERLRYVELPDEQHLVSAVAWERAMRETVGWVLRFAGG